MNNNFFEYAMRLVESISVEDLENGLREFGFDCQRKVALYTELDLSPTMLDVTEADAIRIPVNFSNEDMLSSLEFMAANDNSYALAA